MSKDFPAYSRAAKQGKRGVQLVSRIVSDKFGWLFRLIHQEEDFGIDGHMEIVTKAGAVTSRLIAVQIKFGDSFFSEKNRWGYVYRGEKKHLNYLANCPLPVIICICNPTTKECNWVHFELDKTHITDKGWKIIVPFGNVLSKSQMALEALVPPIINPLDDLKPFREFNKTVMESAVVAYHLDVQDVQSIDVSGPRTLFDRLQLTQELAPSARGRWSSFFRDMTRILESSMRLRKCVNM